MFLQQNQLQSRGARCTARAKRYVPPGRPKPGKHATGGANRPVPDRNAADQSALLEELNAGGRGLLRDEDEQDWGLDDVAEHARARQQQQEVWQQRQEGAGPGPGASALSGEPGRAGVGRGRGRGRAPEVLGSSPLASGLAKVEPAPAGTPLATTAPSAAAGSSSGGGTGGSAAGGRQPAGGAGGAAAAAPPGGSSRVVMEATYARHNPEVAQALRRLGVSVAVQSDPDDEGDDVEEEAGAQGGAADGGRGEAAGGGMLVGPKSRGPSLMAGLGGGGPAAEARGRTGRRAKGAGGSTDEDDDDTLLEYELDTSLGEDPWQQGRPGAGRKGAGGSSSSGAGAGAGGAGWASPLEAAGFAVRTTPTGEVFLERTPCPTSPPPIAAALEELSTPQQVLDFLELCFPAWAANGYRLADMATGRQVPAPTPVEASCCIQALALSARRSDIGGWKCLDLAQGRQVQGLAECLRATPPRLLPEHATAQLSAAYFDSARRFWLEPAAESVQDPKRPKAAAGRAAGVGAAAAGAAAAAAAAPAAAAGAHGAGATAAGAMVASVASAGASRSRVGPPASANSAGPGAAASSSSSAAGSGPTGPAANTSTNASTNNGDSSGDGSEAWQVLDTGVGSGYEALVSRFSVAPEPATLQRLQQLQAEAERVQQQQTQAAQRAAGEAAARRAVKVDCLVSALWGLSSLGGPAYFMQETEALVTILVRCLRSAEGLSGWQAGQVLWALGNARHATPRLEDLESSILKVGGLSAMRPRDVTRVLWGFASLGHTPERLLFTIRPDWSWREAQPAAAAEHAAAGGHDARRGSKRRAKKGGKGGDVRAFTTQQLASVAWALAVMKQVDSVPFGSAWSQLLVRAKEVPPAEPVLTQIWQANLAIHLESSTAAAVAARAAASGAGSSSSSSRRGGGRAPRAEDMTAVGLALAQAAPAAPSASSAGGSTAGGTAGGSQDDAELSAAGSGDSGGVSGEVSASARSAAGRDAGRSSSSSSSGSSGGGQGRVDPGEARALLHRARDVFLAATSGLRRRVQSSYQRQIANSLVGLRMMHLLEDSSPGYSVDVTLPHLSIAIEADGPSHASRTPGGGQLGATAMKRRHLERMGWQVINVPYKEWDRLASEASRKAYLEERINTALVNSVEFKEAGEEQQEA